MQRNTLKIYMLLMLIYYLKGGGSGLFTQGEPLAFTLCSSPIFSQLFISTSHHEQKKFQAKTRKHSFKKQ